MNKGDFFVNYEIKDGIKYNEKKYRDIGIILDVYEDECCCAYFNVFGFYENENIKKEYLISFNSTENSDINNIITDLYHYILKCQEWDADNYHPYYNDFPVFYSLDKKILDTLKEKFND